MSFLLMALSVVILLHLYLYWRLVRSAAGTPRWRRIGLVAVLLLALSTVAAFGLRRGVPTEVGATVSWVGYVWLVVGLYAMLALLVVELPRALLNRGLDPGRRRVLARVLGGAAAVVALGTVGYGLTEARNPRLVRREVTLDRLDPELDGVTIAALSDIHLGAINGRRFLTDVVGRVNAERPDLVAIVGDLVDGTVEELGAAAAPLRDLHAPTYFVTGNHEYFSGAEQWCEFLPTLGVRVLRNERVQVGRLAAGVGRTGRPSPAGGPGMSGPAPELPPDATGGPTFDLAGIDDRTAARSGVAGHRADIDSALVGRDPSRAVVLLAHQPVMVDHAVRRDVDLQISGHTHGGQFLPLGFVVLLDQPVLAGLTRVGRTWLYVTRGVGFWGPPVRVGAPPEITLITLRSGQA